MRQRLDDIAAMLTKIRETPITAPLSTEEGVESVPIKYLLQERIKQLWDREPYKSVQYRLSLAVEEHVTVRASPEWLKRALDLLIDNAIEAMAMSTVKKLNVAARPVGNGVEITLSDTGRGIPEDVFRRLFQEPIKKPKGAKGAGVGLLQAQTIVQTYGGEIKVGSTGPTGTTMVIWLPLETEKLTLS
jgi:signal transduction histidine kinase